MTKPLEISAADTFSREQLLDPYPLIEERRAQCPIAHQTPVDAYVSYDYGDVKPLLADRTGSRDPRKGREGSLGQLMGIGLSDTPTSILFLDPPDHTRLRGLVSRAFSARAVARMQEPIQARTDAMLDAVVGVSTFDLLPALAGPLPTMVIAEMLGVNPADHDRFKAWSDVAVRLLDLRATEEQRAAGIQAREEFGAYLYEQVAIRRATPKDDLISGLVAAADGDDRLSDKEIVTTCRLLLAAGNITTTHLIGNAVHALLTHPEQLQKLIQDPGLINNTIEEVLRYDTPVLVTARTATVPLEVAGCPIPVGETVLASLGGANRDPKEHPNPAVFDITREDPHHVSFGGGIHFCLGAHLARMEARIVVGSLFKRFPTLQLVQEPAPVRSTQFGFRGFSSLTVCK